MNQEDWEEGNFEETLELLREAHREAIPEAHYAAVRARVLAQLQAGRRSWWRGAWVYGFASAAILLLAFWPKHSLRKPVGNRQPVIQAAKQMVELTPEASVAQGNPRRRVRRIHRRHPVLTAATHQVIGPPSLQPLVVKLITDDPNIVIYWISGE